MVSLSIAQVAAVPELEPAFGGTEVSKPLTGGS